MAAAAVGDFDTGGFEEAFGFDPGVVEAVGFDVGVVEPVGRDDGGRDAGARPSGFDLDAGCWGSGLGTSANVLRLGFGSGILSGSGLGISARVLRRGRFSGMTGWALFTG